MVYSKKTKIHPSPIAQNSQIVYLLSMLVIKEVCSVSISSIFETDSMSVLQQTERLNIAIYPWDNKTSQLKELKPGIVQAIASGDLLQLVFKCQSTSRNTIMLRWTYRGTDENEVKLKIDAKNGMALVNKSAEGPPVWQIICADKRNISMANSTWIYTGDSKPPFLYNHNKSVSPILLNDTTIRLPCLLNYPLDNTQYRLQLYKDGVLMKNEANTLTYLPEYGFLLKFTFLEKPFGIYECRIRNSTREDFLKFNFNNGSMLRGEIKVKLSNGLKVPKFFEGNPLKYNFSCSVPKARFKSRVEWYFQHKNGSYLLISQESLNLTVIPDSQLYKEIVSLNFQSKNITHVVCAGYSKDDDVQYNASFAVEVSEAAKPVILNETLSKDPIEYMNGSNLTCQFAGDDLDVFWLKNGLHVERVGLKNEMWRNEKSVRTSIYLNPYANEVENNYTCVAKNFKGEANFTFRVHLNQTEPRQTGVAFVILVTCFSVATLVLFLLLLFFKINVKPRYFSKQKIKTFFHGQSAEPLINDCSNREDLEPYEMQAYDHNREIDLSSLNFEGEELKAGCFGMVVLGRYVRNNGDGHSTEIPVAIKSMKRQSSKALNDYYFENFLKEIKIMQALGEHRNVVGYIGSVVSDLERYNAYLVMEYCCSGDLYSYLRNFESLGGSFDDDIQGLHRRVIRNDPNYAFLGNERPTDIVLKTSHFMKWAEDIACGMEYVSSKNLLHKDLAARNILLACHADADCEHLDPGILTAKISDFGMSKNLDEFPRGYYQLINRTSEQVPILLPLKWMSVETLETLKFTSQNDVWAFGVTLWEMFSFGAIPYDDLDLETEDPRNIRNMLIKYFLDGYTLEQPDIAPENIWRLMLSCWDDCNQRPNFSYIYSILHSINEDRRNH